MTDGTFPFKPMFLESDLQWINQRAKKGEAVQITGLDGTSDRHGYWVSTREYGSGTENVVLGVLFERLTSGDGIIFTYEQAQNGDWNWLRGYQYNEYDSELMYRELERVTAEEETIQWEKNGIKLAARQRTLEAKKQLL